MSAAGETVIDKGGWLRVAKDKGLASLGDSFVNLVYSTAKTRSLNKPVGERVPDRVLALALKMAELPYPARLSSGERGNLVEATLAYAWMNNVVSLEEAVAIVCASISGRLNTASQEREASARAFSGLLRLAVSRMGLDPGE